MSLSNTLDYILLLYYAWRTQNCWHDCNMRPQFLAYFRFLLWFRSYDCHTSWRALHFTTNYWDCHPAMLYLVNILYYTILYYTILYYTIYVHFSLILGNSSNILHVLPNRVTMHSLSSQLSFNHIISNCIIIPYTHGLQKMEYFILVKCFVLQVSLITVVNSRDSTCVWRSQFILILRFW